MTNKTCKELGWEVGDKFEVIEADIFGLGDIVTLVHDDGSSMPKFLRDGDDSDYALWQGTGCMKPLKEEYTGGSSEYYSIFIRNPTDPDVESYWAECNDIIEALDMNFAEGNVFKAVWRKAAARQGKVKKGYDDGLYDSEKIVFFGNRLLTQIKEA